MTDKEIFKKGSTTYYWSSRFFDASVRADVFKLYSFVRVVDDYVDAMPPKTNQYANIVKMWQDGKTDDTLSLSKTVNNTDTRVVNNILQVVNKYHINPSLVDSFLASMQMDLDKKTYHTMQNTVDYMYGSAEVIGLMMSKIIGVPNEAMPYAQMQGRAMQYINFIRDIDEDNKLGRQYFAASELKKYGLTSLNKQEVLGNLTQFEEFIKAQIDTYTQWQLQANLGFKYLPKGSRIAVRTAVDMYNWTARQIQKNPSLLFDKKIKPSKLRVILCGLKRGIYS